MPCTSAVAVPSACTSTDTTPPSPETSRPGTSDRVRERKRFEVRLASRTGAPTGIASYDARSRATASLCPAHPTTSLGPPPALALIEEQHIGPCTAHVTGVRQMRKQPHDD